MIWEAVFWAVVLSLTQIKPLFYFYYTVFIYYFH